MRNSGVVWDEKSLDAFIAEPQKAIPGNTIPFGGISDRKQRAEIVDYLKRWNKNQARPSVLASFARWTLDAFAFFLLLATSMREFDGTKILHIASSITPH